MKKQGKRVYAHEQTWKKKDVPKYYPHTALIPSLTYMYGLYSFSFSATIPPGVLHKNTKKDEGECTRKTLKSWKMAPRREYSRVSRVSLFSGQTTLLKHLKWLHYWNLFIQGFSGATLPLLLLQFVFQTINCWGWIEFKQIISSRVVLVKHLHQRIDSSFLLYSFHLTRNEWNELKLMQFGHWVIALFHSLLVIKGTSRNCSWESLELTQFEWEEEGERRYHGLAIGRCGV